MSIWFCTFWTGLQDKSIKDFQGNLAIHYVREHCFAELKEHLK